MEKYRAAEEESRAHHYDATKEGEWMPEKETTETDVHQCAHELLDSISLLWTRRREPSRWSL